MRVKICGITNLEDALQAVEAGADALGFVFYEKSPRYISVQRAKEIVRSLPPFVERVGLFVNEEAKAIDEICQECGMSLAQLHFTITEDFLHMLQTKALPVIRAKSATDIHRFAGHYRLVDAFVEEYGGAGKRLNLEWFKDVDRSKIVLAGGLNPENVQEVAKMGFYGVDVSSGVEERPGKKDHRKVSLFIKKAKNLE